jgi:hypothetical protein
MPLKSGFPSMRTIAGASGALRPPSRVAASVMRAPDAAAATTATTIVDPLN